MDSMLRETVWDYYHAHGRDMPWRQVGLDDRCNPYHVLVSELMLQQTQVSRVIPKFEQFIRQFPDIAALAAAPLGSVLAAWSGLGYNRRAKYLHEAARSLQNTEVWTIDMLQRCKGIGPHTAAAIIVYSYNQPVPFIETNIRSVYIHHYFPNVDKVSDAQLLPLVERTLDREHPREWYWALMDYGTYLKRTVGNSAAKSLHYSKQSRFAGSDRQLRGRILKLLIEKPYPVSELYDELADDRSEKILAQLCQEGLVVDDGLMIKLG